MSLPHGVRLATPDLAESWDRFVDGTVGASICHLFGWKQVVEQTYGHPCYYLFRGEPEAIEGVLPLVHIKRPFLRGSLVSLPYLDQGGTVSESVEARSALREAALHLAHRLRAASLELRGGDAEELDRLAADSQRFRLILGLPEDVDSLWKSIGAKVRNQIRKSEKCRLSTERVTPAAGLTKFYEIFADSMRQLGSPVHDLRLFQEIFATLGDRARLYLTVSEESEPVAGAVALSFSDSTVVPWAASLRSERKSCPNHSLYWKILREAVERGESSFDFGRSWEGSGTFHFKKQWGAEPHELRWIRLDPEGRPRSEAQLKPQDHRLLTGVWSRLPLTISKWLGPRLRGYLAN